MSSSSAILLGGLVAVLVLAGVLYAVGIIERAVRGVNAVGQRILRWGFSWWQPLFAWAHWSVFLTLVFGLHALLFLFQTPQAWPALLLGAGLIWIGLVTCLACIFFELERCQVLRGTMVLHDPAKGQRLAENLARYGHRAGIPLLLAANVAIISGFALLNEGLFYTFGESWYVVGAQKNNPNIPPEEPVADPSYSDFLAYSLINIFRIVDLIDVANTFNVVRVSYVHQIRWPASTLLLIFKTFYSFVLLQQFFAAMRRFLGLGEILEDFWNPHHPIHERAQAAMAQYGLAALPPLFATLKPEETLPATHRARMVDIVVSLGPNAIPILKKYLHHPHHDVRAVSVAALGRLEAIDLVRAGAGLIHSPELAIRQALVEALATLAQQGEMLIEKANVLRESAQARRRIKKFWKRIRFSGRELQPLDALAEMLKLLVTDPDATIRASAVQGLGYLKSRSAVVAPVLLPLLADPEVQVRVHVLRALANLDAIRGDVIAQLLPLLREPIEAVQLATLDALASNPVAEKEAAPHLLPLLHDRNDAVRGKIFQALERMNALPAEAKPQLLAGLEDDDNEVRARTIEALGTLGDSAADAMPALLQTLNDENDQVRAKAVEALGKLPPTSASTMALGRALDDHDIQVRVMAATALGGFGAAAHASIDALLLHAEHSNATLRASVLEALAKIWSTTNHSDSRCLTTLQQALADADVSVRAQLVPHVAACLRQAAEPLLTHALRDDAATVRAAAAQALGTLDTLLDTTNEQLAQALREDNDTVQLAAALTLAEKGQPTADVLDGLIGLLHDTNPDVQLQGALALSKFGSAAQSAGEALAHVAKTAPITVREQALKALALTMPEQAVPTFMNALHDPDAAIRKIASAGFLRVPQLRDEEITALLDGLQDPDAQVRANIAFWLARQDQVPEAAIPLLLRCVGATDDGLRLSVVRCLRSTTDPLAQQSLAVLLDDPHDQVRAEAAVLLLHCNPQHPTAPTIIDQTLADPSYAQRKALLNLLAKYADDPAFQQVAARWLALINEPE